MGENKNNRLSEMCVCVFVSSFLNFIVCERFAALHR
jgi:hypothetical protein